MFLLGYTALKNVTLSVSFLVKVFLSLHSAIFIGQDPFFISRNTRFFKLTLLNRVKSMLQISSKKFILMFSATNCVKK